MSGQHDPSSEWGVDPSIRLRLTMLPLYAQAVGAPGAGSAPSGSRRRLGGPVIIIGNRSVAVPGKRRSCGVGRMLSIGRATGDSQPRLRSAATRGRASSSLTTGDLATLARAGDEPLMLARARAAGDCRGCGGPLSRGSDCRARLGATVHVLDDGSHVGLRGASTSCPSQERSLGSRAAVWAPRESAAAAARAHARRRVVGRLPTARSDAWTLGISQDLRASESSVPTASRPARFGPRGEPRRAAGLFC